MTRGKRTGPKAHLANGTSVSSRASRTSVPGRKVKHKQVKFYSDYSHSSVYYLCG